MSCSSCPSLPTTATLPGYRTTLRVPGLGNLPVLQGDPKWLPSSVVDFICSQAAIMRPSAVWICNGSVYEEEKLKEILVKRGVMEKLSAYDNVYLARTDSRDTARVEKQSYISTAEKAEVVATRKGNYGESELARWMSRSQLETELGCRFPGCMRGRTLYVIPFSMGPIAAPWSRNAVQLTDSPYVVINMRIMTRVSSSVWDSMAAGGPFVRCVHSVGCPRPLTRALTGGWFCDPERILVAHRLPELEVYSYGSGYGGNSLLGKKCLALRLGSYLGWKEGWLAEHAALLSLTNPDGKEMFFCFSCPSGVGKTALATMLPTLPGWKIRILGDDITWLRFDKNDGRLYAMAPENGMFGIAADVRPDSGKNIVEQLSRNSLLVNAGSTSKGHFIWNGLETTLEKDEQVTTWKRAPWTAGAQISHPNCRFTSYTSSAPNVHPQWDGAPVPISAYIWGSRRPDAFPLVVESSSWSTAVTLAATMRTQQAGHVAADKTTVGGQLVHDPMSMRPFMSINFANYVAHWMMLGMQTAVTKPPATFHVNWYREERGELLWPGYGENIRVLEWIFSRVMEPTDGQIQTTPIGLNLPAKINLDGMAGGAGLEKLTEWDKPFWQKELEAMEEVIRREMGEEKVDELEATLNEMKKGLQK